MCAESALGQSCDLILGLFLKSKFGSLSSGKAFGEVMGCLVSDPSGSESEDPGDASSHNGAVLGIVSKPDFGPIAST